MAEARRRLPQWAAAQGFAGERGQSGDSCTLQQARARHITVETEAIDGGVSWPASTAGRAWDLVIAQAFLDLMDVPATLPGASLLLQPRRALYFPITFDGGTVFQPESDPEFDRAIEACYHQAIDQRLLDWQAVWGQSRRAPSVCPPQRRLRRCARGRRLRLGGFRRRQRLRRR